MNCQSCKTSLPNLLLDPNAASNDDARAHLESCSACNAEFQQLQATFDLLDAWVAPEPSPYFDQKLAVRLREEQAAPPAGWFERLRMRLQFNTGRQFRPAMAGALALALIVAGGTAFDLSVPARPAHVQPSATLNDLQILDKNDQALQTMDQLLQDDTPAEDGTSTTPAS